MADTAPLDGLTVQAGMLYNDAHYDSTVVFNLGSSSTSVLTTWTGMTPADVADLSAGNFYVDIHSSLFASGEIHCQSCSCDVRSEVISWRDNQIRIR